MHTLSLLRPKPARERLGFSFIRTVSYGGSSTRIVGCGTPGGFAVVEVRRFAKSVGVAMEVAAFFVGETTAFIGCPEPACIGFGDEL